MEKLKDTLKGSWVYIVKGKALKYILFLLLIASVPSAFFLKKAYNERYNSKNESSNVENEFVATGTINTEVNKNDSDKTPRSTYTVDEGFDNYVEEESSSSNSNDYNNVSNTTNYVNKSSLLGNDLTISEGDSFNVTKDLQLKATDKDGTDITSRISIEKNDVNTTKPGNYKVKAYVILNDGARIEKEFLVTVKETPLDVSIESFKAEKDSVEKNDNISFNLDLNISKSHISPVAVMINGTEYPVYKGKQSIFRALSNKRSYKVNVKAGDLAGNHNYNMTYIKMSDNTIITTDNTEVVNILKEEAKVKNFTYEEETLARRIKATFAIEDKDNTTSNTRLEIYKDKEIIKTIELDKKENYTVYIPMEYNGKYKVKVVSDINRTGDIEDESVTYNNVLFEESVIISKIDRPTIVGKSIEILQGDDFDPAKDLSIVARDEDGNDITDKVIFDSNVDINTPGRYKVKATVSAKNGKEYSAEFTVVVKVVKVSSEEYETVEEEVDSFIRMIDEDYNLRSVNSTKGTVSGPESSTLTSSVTMNGSVDKADGTAANGRIQVELPTSMSFVVDKDGAFISANAYEVKNKSSVDIELSVQQFNETNTIGGITIKPENEVNDSLDRSNVSLKLVAGGSEVDLANVDPANPILLGTIGQSSSLTMNLSGKAGKKVDNNAGTGSVDHDGASEDFTVVFKIKKKS